MASYTPTSPFYPPTVQLASDSSQSGRNSGTSSRGRSAHTVGDAPRNGHNLFSLRCGATHCRKPYQPRRGQRGCQCRNRGRQDTGSQRSDTLPPSTDAPPQTRPAFTSHSAHNHNPLSFPSIYASNGQQSHNMTPVAPRFDVQSMAYQVASSSGHALMVPVQVVVQNHINIHADSVALRTGDDNRHIDNSRGHTYVASGNSSMNVNNGHDGRSQAR